MERLRIAFWLLAGIGLTVSLIAAQPRVNQSLAVMSSGGFTAAYEELSALFTEQTRIRLDTRFGASMGGAPSSIPNRLDRAEPAGVVILAREGLDRLVMEGHVLGDSRVDLASSRIGMAVREGNKIPDIGTVDAFVQVLRQAESIAYSASASGTYLSTVLFPRLGIEEELALKSTRVVGERVGAIVARGDAEIGFQQVSELLPIDGTTFVGPIPDDVQRVTTFSAGVTVTARDPELAHRLIAFLSSEAAAPIIERTGMAPVSSMPVVRE